MRDNGRRDHLAALGPGFAVHLVGDDGRIVTPWRTL
jgi:hypothetical protein